MADNLSPGLYPKERAASAGAIAGVTASTYATCGWLRKGPVDEPQLITSFAKFVQTYGTYWRNSYIPFMVDAFFNNEGTRCWINRVVPSSAVKAASAAGLDSAATQAIFYTRKLADPVITLAPGKYNIKVTVSGGTATTIDVTGDAGVGGSYALSVIAGVVHPILQALSPKGSCVVEATVGGGSRLKFFTDVAGATSSLKFEEPAATPCSKELLGLDTTSTSYTYNGEAAIDWSLLAKWAGAAYNQNRMCITGNLDSQDGHGGHTAFDVEIQEESAVGAGDWDAFESEIYEALIFDNAADDNFAPTVINERTNIMTITQGVTFGIPRVLKSYSRANECVAEGNAALQTFSGTLLYPALYAGSLRIVAGAVTATDQGDNTLTGAGVTSGTINYTTGAWSVTFAVAPGSGVLIMAQYDTTAPSTELCAQLTGGTDGTGPLTRGDVSDPALSASKKGIYAFNTVEEILNLSLPDFAGVVAVANDITAYAAGRQDIFGIHTTAIAQTPTNVEQWVRRTAQYNTSYGALYYPWVKIYDPIANDGRTLTVPPDGFVAGVYARTDSRRNVGKSPGGITDGQLVGVLGLERNLDQGERDLLYPARVNPIISTPSTGRCVWGVRTLSLDAEWRYVNARRLFIYVKKAVYNASWWIVFENNGPALWARIKSQGDAYLLNLFNDGYFAGETPADAFLVKCDADNNPQSSIDAGIVIVDYYLAPNKPGEFVWLQFRQKTKSAA